MKLFEKFTKAQLTRVSFVLSPAIILAIALGASPPKTAEDEIIAALGLKSGELINVDQVSKNELAITMSGHDYMIDYAVFSNRSENFKLLVQGENGELVEQDAPPANTIRGSLRGVAGSRVVGCVTEAGCCAKIKFPFREDCYIEPVSRSLDDPAFAGVHVVYSKEDVIESGKLCGTVTERDEANQEIEQNPVGPRPRSISTLRVAEIALDTDFEYFSIFGSTAATLNRLELVINIVNDQYENQAGIRHTISGVIVRSNANDPYTATGRIDLLFELLEFYTTGPGNGTISGDVLHLFTGRTFEDFSGISFLGVVCDPDSGFGLSSNLLPLAFSTNLVAHELGHNWNLEHCACPNNTMNPVITGANEFNNSDTVPALTAFRDTLTCLDSLGPPGSGSTGVPVNDDRLNEVFIAEQDFSVSGSNFNATTERDEQNLDGVGSTVWWFFDSASSGTVTIDTFGSDFDTQLHVYEFIPSAGFAGLALVANNDDTGGGQSQVTFDVAAATRYEIRVGGSRSIETITSGSEGNIVLNGSFTEVLKGDVDMSGTVDFADIPPFIAVLQAGTFQAEADADCSTAVGFADIPAFITILQGQ